jgi:hypothetical protein
MANKTAEAKTHKHKCKALGLGNTSGRLLEAKGRW